MTFSSDDIKAAVCQNEYKAFLAGAAVTGLGFDMFLLRVSGGLLNPMVHMAAAGMGVNVWCRGGVPSDYQRLAMCGLAGVAGGVMVSGVQGALRIGPPLGEVVL